MDETLTNSDSTDSDVENEYNEEIKKFTNMINSVHESVQLEGLIGIRRLISRDEFPSIQQVIDSGILPKLLEVMTWENEFRFQFESSWCVLNICATEDKFSDYVCELGGLDIVINLLGSPLEEIVGNAVWTIGNIAAGTLEQRETCLQKGCLDKLLQALKKFPTSDVIIENALRGIANLCLGDMRTHNERLLLALPVLHKHISEVHSQETLAYALWSLANITQEIIQEVIDQGCVPFIIHHLCNGRRTTLVTALRTVGNLTAGTHEQTNELLKFPELLPRLFELAVNSNAFFRKEALWAISNITAGTPEQIEMIMKGEGYISRLQTIISTGAAPVAKEAAWTILNVFCEANTSQIHRLIEKNYIMKSFPHFLTKFGRDVKEKALKAIKIIIEAGHKTFDCGTNPLIKHIREAGITDIIRDLARDSDFSENADLILKYLSPENPEESENSRE